MDMSVPSMILFEDDDLIVLNKPAGLPSQSTLDPRRPHLFGLVQTYQNEKNGPHAYVGLHHRLDRDTSGVIVMTKARRANKGLAEQISGHQLKKTYLCLVDLAPEMPDAWCVENHLRKKPGRPARMHAVRSGGDYAKTEFRKLKEGPTWVLLEARPHTGRMHQIRVHLSEAGYPIWGDPLYAPIAVRKKARRTLLHAWHLELVHPITGEQMKFEAPLPRGEGTDTLVGLSVSNGHWPV